MFCPNCGKTVDAKLKYCNGCGERLSKADEVDADGMPGKMLDNILTGIFLIVMVGLGILVGLVAVLLGNDVQIAPVVVIVFAYLTAIFGICFMLLKQVPKLIDARLKAMNLAEHPRSLQAPITAQLEEFREPAMSVTEHTTRTLDKAPAERN